MSYSSHLRKFGFLGAEQNLADMGGMAPEELLLNAAGHAAQDGDWRQCADCYIKGYLRCPCDRFSVPIVYNIGYNLLSLYFLGITYKSLLYESYVVLLLHSKGQPDRAEWIGTCGIAVCQASCQS